MPPELPRNAIDEAFKAQAALLFRELCNQWSADQDGARAHFRKGLNIAIEAHAAATAELRNAS